MNRVLGIFLGLIAFLIVCCIGVMVIPGDIEIPNPFATLFETTEEAPEDNDLSLVDKAKSVIDDAKIAATNAAIDVSGIKGRISDTLESYKDDFIASTGVPESVADAIIEDIAIDDWQAAILPENVYEIDTIDGTPYGIEGTITTYDDPGYITVNTYGQNITLAIPESAQDYLPYLTLFAE